MDKKNFTDTLIETYLKEDDAPASTVNINSFDYKPVLVSPAEQAAAEKAFKDELVNGPEKMVHYASGSFRKRIGTFDLDNFHKAYDKWFVDNNLLDVFNSDGKLKTKGTYYEWKDKFDKKTPAISGLNKLYGACFNHDMEFTADKLAKKKAEEDEAAAKVQLEQDRKDCAARFNDPAVLNKVTSTKEWSDLINAYPKDTRENIKPVVNVVFNHMAKDVLIVEASLIIEGIIRPPVKDLTFGRIVVKNNNNESEEEVLKKLFNPKAITDMLINAKKIIPAAMLMINNYNTLLKRPEADEPGLNCGKGGLDENWMVYFDRDHNRFYRTALRSFPTVESASPFDITKSKTGLMLIDVENETFKAGELTPACILVAARVNYSSDSGRCYEKVTYIDFYNSISAPKHILDKLDIITKDIPSEGNGSRSVSIRKASESKYPSLAKFFDTASYFYYERDLSD